MFKINCEKFSMQRSGRARSLWVQLRPSSLPPLPLLLGPPQPKLMPQWKFSFLVLHKLLNIITHVSLLPICNFFISWTFKNVVTFLYPCFTCLNYILTFKNINLLTANLCWFNCLFFFLENVLQKLSLLLLQCTLFSHCRDSTNSLLV